MTTALYLLLYSAAVAWLAPGVLTRATRRGLSPGFGVAAWLTAVVGTVAASAAAVVLVVVSSADSLANSTAFVLCLELIGVPEQVATPGRVTLILLIGAGVSVSTIVAVNVGRSVLELRSRSREHASAARLIGAATDHPDVVVVTAEQPAAYCVLGTPNAIVVTSAAIDRLDDSELAAVLAHEHAHLSGRHHQLLMVLRALALSLPGLPLFSRAASAVGELLEMCADDAAVRRHGRGTLVSGMITLAGPAVDSSLAAAATAVAVRAHRLLDPVRRQTVARHRVLMSVAITFFASAPVIVNELCKH